VSPVDGRPRMIFVLGTGRCGSTLVEEILCRHPSVGFVSNLEDRYPLPRQRHAGMGACTADCRPGQPRRGASVTPPRRPIGLWIASSRQCSAHRLATCSPRTSPPGWIGASASSSSRGVRAAGGHLHPQADRLAADRLSRPDLPEARFIHVIRDGRAVANSWLQMPWWLGYGGPERWQWDPLAGAGRRMGAVGPFLRRPGRAALGTPRRRFRCGGLATPKGTLARGPLRGRHRTSAPGVRGHARVL